MHKLVGYKVMPCRNTECIYAEDDIMEYPAQRFVSHFGLFAEPTFRCGCSFLRTVEIVTEEVIPKCKQSIHLNVSKLGDTFEVECEKNSHENDDWHIGRRYDGTRVSWRTE